MITRLLRILCTRSLKPLVFDSRIEDSSEFNMNSFGIYVHIPFCKTLCAFCPYNKVKYDKNLAKEYKEALIKEIRYVGDKCSKNNVSSIYFGGGTPILMLDNLKEILNEIKSKFNLIECKIGIELHPRDITRESLKKLKSIGFNMISIGIQSFEKKSLENLGREYINGEEKVKLVQEEEFEVIDVDLIFGIKGQSVQSLKDDFLKAFKNGATQVSTYPFIDFSYANNKNKPMGVKKKKELLECLDKVYREIECDRTSVWTFGKKNVHKYSSITRDLYIGFGASAATLTYKAFKINIFSVKEYIKNINKGKRPIGSTMEFNKKTRMLYWLFWNAYTLKLDNEKFRGLFGDNLEKYFKIELKIGLILKLIKKNNNGYKLTKKGAYIYHLIEQKYTHQYIDKVWRIQRENPNETKINLY